MARVSYSPKKNNFVLLGLIVCLICLLFFSTTFALLAFQEKFSVDITLGYISLNDIGKASLDVSLHDVGDLVCSNGVSFVKDADSRNFYARVNIYYYSNDDLTTSNKKYIALLNGMIEPASYNDYSWSERIVDSYYLTTTYGEPYEIDEFVEPTTRFYFLDSLTFGQGVESYLEKYDRPEHIYLNVEIQAIQSEYFETVDKPIDGADNRDNLERVKDAFVNHFGDVNRLDYQLVLYHDIYSELFDIGFVQYGKKLFEPAQPQFVIGNFKHWCTSRDGCDYHCTASGTCSCGSASCECKVDGCEGGPCTCPDCLCSDAYNFDLPVTRKLYLYARYDIEMGNIEELYLFSVNDDGTYTISQNYKKNEEGLYDVDDVTGKPIPAPKNGVVLPKIYNFGRVTKIGYIEPEINDPSKATEAFKNYFETHSNLTSFGGNTQITGIVISENITEIEASAFEGCTEVEEIAIFEGVQYIYSRAFYGMGKVKEIVIPDSVQSLGAEVLGNFFSLEEVTLPFVGSSRDYNSTDTSANYFGYIFNSSGASIEDREKLYIMSHISKVLMDSYKLVKFFSEGIVDEDYTHVSDNIFYDYDEDGVIEEVAVHTLSSIPVSLLGISTFYTPVNLASVTINGGEIHDYSMSDFTPQLANLPSYYPSKVTHPNITQSITEINFGAGVTRIGKFACFNTILLFLDISDSLSLEIIDEYAFFGCQSIVSVTLEDNIKLETIGEGAFGWGGAIDYVSLEGCEALKYIKSYAFATCREMRNIYLPPSVEEINNFAFFGCINLELPELSGRLVTIGDFAFYNNKKIQELDLATTNLVTVGHYAFDRCEDIFIVKFPNSLKTIGDYSFAHCSQLTDFVVPPDVTYMGTGCIAGCYQLTELILPFVGREIRTGPGENPNAAATIKSSSTKYDLLSNIFSTETAEVSDGVQAHEKNHDVTSTTMLKYEGNEFYNLAPTEYSVVLQAYYTSKTSIAGYYGVYSYIFAYLPKNLKTLTIQNGYIRVGAMSGLKTIEQITIGKNVVGIDHQAFIDTVNVASISLPFVGTSPTYSSSNVTSLFGVIFDSHSTYMDYDTGMQFVTNRIGSTSEIQKKEIFVADQYFGENSANKKTYNIPLDLVSITITGGKLQYGCLSGLTYLRSAAVEEGCLGLGKRMFFNCENLTSLTLGLICEDTSYISPSSSTLLAYYFGTTSSSIGTEKDEADLDTEFQYRPVGQRYKEGTAYDLTEAIPRSLVNLTINGGSILYGACMNIPSIKTVLITGSVKSIGDYAFYNTGMTSLTVQNLRTLTTFGRYTFALNVKLVDVVFANNQLLSNLSDNLFDTCIAMPKIEYTGSPKLATAEDSTFARCTSISQISDVLPSTIVSIGDYCFEECTGLLKIEFPQSLLRAGRYAFYNCSGATEIIYTNENFVEIKEGLFKQCSSLEVLKIGQYIKIVGAYAFSECTGATSIEYNSLITSIPERCFEFCTGLPTIVIGSSIRTLGEAAFSHCEGATSITYNNYLTEISKQAFEHCYNLKISFSSKIVTVGDYAFAFSARTGATNRTIDFSGASSLKTLGKGAFAFCGLTSIDLTSAPDSIEKYGEYCFYENRKNKTIVLPEEMKCVPKYCFANNISVTSITIPSSLTGVLGENSDGDQVTNWFGDSCFEYCVSLKTVTYAAGSNVTRLSNSVFRACLGFETLTVPHFIMEISDSAYAGVDSFMDLFYAEDESIIAPYEDDLADYYHMNEDANTRYIMEDDYKNENYGRHPDLRTLADWFKWYYDNTVERKIGTKAEALVAEILTGVNANPLPMNIKEIIFDTWTHWNDTDTKVKNDYGRNPARLQIIGDKAFYLNTKLTYLEFPRSLTEIGAKAFASVDKDGYRTEMDYVLFPYDSLIGEIGEQAFAQKKVWQMHFVNRTTVPKLDSSNAFTYISDANTDGIGAVYVLNGYQTSFRNAANWKAFSSKIFQTWNGKFDKSGALTVDIYGSGSSTANYEIFHANQLTYIGERVNFGKNTYSGIYFLVVRNLYMGNNNWRPIGITTSYLFQGKFNGGADNAGTDASKYVYINNLTMKALPTTKGLYGTSNTYYVMGLFGYTGTSATLENIFLNSIAFDFRGSVYYAGGVCASALRTVKNCEVKGTMKIIRTNGDLRIGGILAGALQSGSGTLTVSGSRNYVDTNGSYSSGILNIGGIVAYTPYTNPSTTISNCFNYGRVSGYSSSKISMLGGIIGLANSTAIVEKCQNVQNGTAANVYSTSGNKRELGGIIGRMLFGAKMTGCKSKGTIESTGSPSTYAYLGGYIGTTVYTTTTNDPTSESEAAKTYTSTYITVGAATSDAMKIIAGSSTTSCGNKTYAGGLIGFTIQKLSGLTFTGSATMRAYYAGGITSYANNLNDSSSNLPFMSLTTTAGSLVSNDYYNGYTGGIVGYVNYTDNANYKISTTNTNRATVQNNSVNGTSYTGGVYGYVNYKRSNSGTYSFTFSSQTNYGTVKGGKYVGGIVGYYYNEPRASTSWIGGGSTSLSAGFTGMTNSGAVQCTAGGENFTGGIAGWAGVYLNFSKGWASWASGFGTMTFTGTNSGAITGKYHTGGIVGYLSVSGASGLNDCAAAVKSCTNTGSVSGSNWTSGGIVGCLARSSNTKVEFSSCTNGQSGTSYGAISLAGTGDYGSVGGILAYTPAANTTTTFTFSSCKNYGSVRQTGGNYTHVGGIVGFFVNYNRDATNNSATRQTGGYFYFINSCINYNSNIYGNGSSTRNRVGGIAGMATFTYNGNGNTYSNVSLTSNNSYVGKRVGYTWEESWRYYTSIWPPWNRPTATGYRRWFRNNGHVTGSEAGVIVNGHPDSSSK